MPPAFSLRLGRVNGEPGIIMYIGAMAYGVISAELSGDKVAAIRIVINPDKMTRVPGL